MGGCGCSPYNPFVLLKYRHTALSSITSSGHFRERICSTVERTV